MAGLARDMEAMRASAAASLHESEEKRWEDELPELRALPLEERVKRLKRVESRVKGSELDLTEWKDRSTNKTEPVPVVRPPTTVDPFNDLTRPEVFISKRTEDFSGSRVDPTRRDFPAFLTHVLEHLGLRTFFDKHTIKSGLEIGAAISHVLPSCRLLLLLLSEGADQSKWLKMEVVTAACSGTPILPVLFGDGLDMRPNSYPSVIKADAHVRAFDLRVTGERRAESVDRLERLLARAWQAVGRPGLPPSRERVLEAYTFAECALYEWHEGAGKLQTELVSREEADLDGRIIKLSGSRLLSLPQTAGSAELSEIAIGGRMEQPEVFISYRGTGDQPGLARLLHATLTAAGVRAFVDVGGGSASSGLLLGETFSGDLISALRVSPVVVSLVCADFETGAWCKMEALAALSWDKLYVPVLTDAKLHDADAARAAGFLPPVLARHHVVKAFRDEAAGAGHASFKVDTALLLQRTLGRVLQLLQRSNWNNTSVLRVNVQRAYVDAGLAPPLFEPVDGRLLGECLTLPRVDEAAGVAEHVEAPQANERGSGGGGGGQLSAPFAYVSWARAPRQGCDSLFAELLHFALTHLRVRVEPPPGTRGHARAGADAALVHGARVVVAVLSPATNQCEATKLELSRAVYASKSMVPVLVDCDPDSMPPAIKTFRGELLQYAPERDEPAAGGDALDAAALRLDSNLTALGRLLNSVWRLVQETDSAGGVEDLLPHQVRLALSTACRAVFARRAGGWPPPLPEGERLPRFLFDDFDAPEAAERVPGRGLELLRHRDSRRPGGELRVVPALALPRSAVDVEPWRPSTALPRVYILADQFGDGGMYSTTQAMARLLKAVLVDTHVHLDPPSLQHRNAAALHSALVVVVLCTEGLSLNLGCQSVLRSAIEWQRSVLPVFCGDAAAPGRVPRMVDRYGGIITGTGAVDHAIMFRIVRAVLDLLGPGYARLSNAAIRKQMLA